MRKDSSFSRREPSRFGGSNQRGGRDFGNRSFGNRSGGGSFAPMMHDAVCAKCGKDCQVPFKPTGNREVFCSNCYERDERGGDRDSNRNFNSNRESSFGDKQMFSATCDKCGNRCEVPFRPTSGKPVYCSDCFSKTSGRFEERDSRQSNTSGGSSSGGNNDEIKKQFEILNRKLDEIQKLLNPKAFQEAKTVKVEEVKKPSTVEKFFEKEEVVAPVAEVKPKAEVKQPVKKVAEKKAKVVSAKKETKKEVKKVVKKATKKAVKKTAKKA